MGRVTQRDASQDPAVHAQALGGYRFVQPIVCEAIALPIGSSNTTAVHRYTLLVRYLDEIDARIKTLADETGASSNSSSSSAVDSDMSPPAAQEMGVTAKSAEERQQRELKMIKSVDAACLDAIQNELLDTSPGISFDDIVGADEAKQTLDECCILPMSRPDLFTGIRRPPRGVLLYGPPGTGKTMLAKAVASESKCKFYVVSATTLVSKWVGQSEQLVKALFTAARVTAPSVIFIDEIDGLLSKRSSDESDHTKRLKNELLMQMDGMHSSADDRVLVLGATNYPELIDDAALRRLGRRIHVGLPDAPARATLLDKFLTGIAHSLTPAGIRRLATDLELYSASDIHLLCTDVAMRPLRDLTRAELAQARVDTLRPITEADVRASAARVRPITDTARCQFYVTWGQ